MIIKCSRCGFMNKDGARFCVNCGNNLEENSTTHNRANNTSNNNTNDNAANNTNNNNARNNTSNNNARNNTGNNNAGNNGAHNNTNSNIPINNLEWLGQQIYEGNLPLPTDGCPIILKKSETPVLVLHNVTLKEPRSVRTSVGGYGGPTIRIAKGFSLRLGGVSHRSMSHEEIHDIDRGTLTITNKRLIFSGSMKLINYNLSKILSITDYKDAIAIQRDNKQKTEYFANLDNIILTYQVDDQSGKTPFYGFLLKAAILGQME